MRLMFSPLGTLLILVISVPSFAEGPANIIRTAEAFTYKQLLAQGVEPMKYAEDCCSLLYSPGTPKSDYHFDLENAYFIRVTVDAVKLAPVLFRMSCQNRGFITPTTECTPDELKTKINEALKVDYPGSLYGKYRSSWVAKQNGQALPKTEKWVGQTIHSFKREDGVDEIVLGPIKGAPTTVELQGIDELPVTPAVSER